MSVDVRHGDCLEVMRSMPDASVDAIVTDPPYGLGFMGKAWDALPPGEEWAAECLRVLKPGGHLLAFGGTRTWHRLAVAVEDAGFEIRDSIAWMHGQGFPKSLDVSKAIDKAAGAKREVVGRKGGRAAYGYKPELMGVAGSIRWTDCTSFEDAPQAAKDYYTRAAEERGNITAPATDDARTWEGWGTALKPAFEPVVVARKPFGGTVAGNVLAHGTGALNIDGARNQGRWPANVVLDESQAAALDEQSGERRSGWRNTDKAKNDAGVTIGKFSEEYTGHHYEDSGGASRFFFIAREGKDACTKNVDGAGTEWTSTKTGERASAAVLTVDATSPRFLYVAKASRTERVKVGDTAHPTVKPLKLMRWLVRLVTPPGGTVLDPFAGSGTTIEAALIEGFNVIGIEREADYLPLIQARIDRCGVLSA